MGSAQSTSCEKLSVSCAVKKGEYMVDGYLNELRNETITVLETGHYRERCNNGRSIILHDFVGFRVRLEDGVTFRIKAEKVDSGISVKLPLRWNEDVEMKYACENLEDCVKIRIEDLLAILKEPSPDYNLMSDNSWSYADATFKQVIRKFSETPSLNPERKSYLESFLNNAPPVMPDEVLGSVKSAVVRGVKAEHKLNSVHTSATQAVHAPLITHTGHLVLWKAFIVKGAACVAFIEPHVAVGVACAVAIYVPWKVGTLLWDGTVLREGFKKWRRSLSPRPPLKQAQGLPPM